MLFELVRQARRRFLWNEVLAQFAWTLSAALAAAILLLLAGTQILDWYWLVLLPASAFGIGMYRVARRLPSAYHLAQVLDHRLSLQDTLSTAVFFAAGERPAAEWIRDAQRRHADELAHSVRLEEALPFRMPRGVYCMALLGLVATSLFALRYGLDRRLDLKPPLARVIMERFYHQPAVQQAANRKQQGNQRKEQKDQLAKLTDPNQEHPGELDPSRNATVPPDSQSNVENGKAQIAKTDPPSKQDSAQPAEEQNQSDSAEDANTSGQPNGQPGKGMPKSQNALSRSSASSGENSSLMNKFRDAMQNLLSRMRQSGGQSASMRQGSQGRNSRQASSQAGRDGQRGNQSQQNAQSGESKDGDQSQQARNAQNAQGKGTGQSADQKTKQPGSGVGREDGSKDVKLAEQLAAMGKISEIIGKRAANVSGEVTVEVQSTGQQLRTAYTQRSAKHQEAGGEISRDEVPIALQQYVQQYFEQVRHQGQEAAPAVHRRGAK